MVIMKKGAMGLLTDRPDKGNDEDHGDQHYPPPQRGQRDEAVVPAPAGGPQSLLAHTKAKSEAKKVSRIRIIPPGGH